MADTRATVSQVIAGWLDSAGKHPKSTGQAVITAIGILLPIAVLKHWISVDLAGALGTALGAAKIAIGGVQQDPGKTEAIPASGGPPVMLKSHEVPDDPTATPVPEGTANPTPSSEGRQP